MDTSSDFQPTAHPPRRLRVLLVDDEPRFLTVMRMLLQEEHDLTAVEGGRAASALLERDGDFDFVVCDLMMPEVSGMEVYERATARHPELAERFVVITGGACSPRSREFLSSHPLPRLEKPFHAAELTELVYQLAARSGVS